MLRVCEVATGVGEGVGEGVGAGVGAGVGNGVTGIGGETAEGQLLQVFGQLVRIEGTFSQKLASARQLAMSGILLQSGSAAASSHPHKTGHKD